MNDVASEPTNFKSLKAVQLFSSCLQGFEIEAIRACRGLQVAMAVNVFGVGTLLPNDLSDRASENLGESNFQPLHPSSTVLQAAR